MENPLDVIIQEIEFPLAALERKFDRHPSIDVFQEVSVRETE
jgi:hypothetical protein